MHTPVRYGLDKDRAMTAARSFAFNERTTRDVPLTTSGYADYTDDRLPYFMLRVGVRDKVLYVRRKMRGTGKLVFHRLGAVGDKPLAQYRVDAERVAGLLAAGKDPSAPKIAKGALALRPAFDGYLAAKGKQLAANTVKSYKSDFEQTYGPWSTWPVQQVTADRVLRRHHERSEESSTRAVGALRVLRAVWRYTTAASAAEGEPITWPDPLVKARRT